MYLLIFFMLLSSGSFFAASRYSRRYEEVLPVTSMSMVLLLFLFGLLGILKIGFYAIIVLALLLYLLGFLFLFQFRSWKHFSVRFFTTGFFCFLALYLFLIYINSGKVAASWDEFTHWVDIVKVMTMLDDFGTSPGSHSAFQSYPPAIALLSYVLQKLQLLFDPHAPFSEWCVYLTHQLFFLIPLFPFFSKHSFKNPLNLLIFFLSIFIVPILLYNDIYMNCQVDGALGVIAGTAFAMIALWDRKDLLYSLTIGLLCSMLVLMKDAGILFAAFISLAYFLDYRKQDSFRSSAFSKQNILCLIFPFLMIVLCKLLWKLELVTSHAQIAFDQKFDWSVFWNLILQRDHSYRSEVFPSFLLALKSNSIYLGSSTLIFNYPFLIFLISALLYLCYRSCRKYERIHSSLKPVAGAYYVLMVCYIIGLCFTYIFKFSPGEAASLASFTRYINIIFQCGLILITLIFLEILRALPDKDYLPKVLAFLLLVFLVPSALLGNIIFKKNVINSIEKNEKYHCIVQKIEEAVPADSQVYFISQADSQSNTTPGYDFWATRFAMRPVYSKKTFSPSIGEPYGDGDIWTKYISPSDWMDLLLDGYDYVILYQVNDNFLDHYSILFEDPSKIKNNTIFKVDHNEKRLVYCQ